MCTVSRGPNLPLRERFNTLDVITNKDQLPLSCFVAKIYQPVALPFLPVAIPFLPVAIPFSPVAIPVP
jgi:hypothetical protein